MEIVGYGLMPVYNSDNSIAYYQYYMILKEEKQNDK